MNTCPPAKLCDVADTKFEELDKRWSDRLTALEKAIEKSEQLLTIRLEEMNNFRKQITDERQAYMTRRESVLISIIISLLIVVVGAFVTHMLMK